MSNTKPPQYSFFLKDETAENRQTQFNVTFCTAKKKFYFWSVKHEVDVVYMSNANVTVEEAAKTAIEHYPQETPVPDFSEIYVYKDFRSRVDKSSSYTHIFGQTSGYSQIMGLGDKMIVSNHPSIGDLKTDRKVKEIVGEIAAMIFFVLGVVAFICCMILI